MNPEPLRRDDEQSLLRHCEQHELLARLGDKWAVLVMYALATGPAPRQRFSVILKGIEGITQRMLTVTLRDLERDGLATRHYFPEVPPRVEYELTATGANMLRSLESFSEWIRSNSGLIVDARRAFDARDKDPPSQ